MNDNEFTLQKIFIETVSYYALVSELLKHNPFLIGAICLLMILSSFHFNQVVLGQAQETLNQNSIVELTAEKVGESYVWKSNDLGINPLLNLKSNETYTFLIASFQNDTAEHELIIEPRAGGEHLVESEEIEHGSTSQFTLNTG
ncbi:MAG TPA: hypothetical protein VER14_07550, partial [Phototrophicaceae bacterium]|nr:hypothetical protein [Phototrophicaceae bacterium]